MRKAILAVLLAFTSLGGAQEFKPFPGARITVEQWKAYFEQVSSKNGLTKREFADQKLVVFEDPESKISWAFTVEGHPAHPAWVTRQPVQDGRGVSIRQIGYFAGEEAPFAEMFRAYQALNAKVREDFEARKEQSK